MAQPYSSAQQPDTGHETLPSPLPSLGYADFSTNLAQHKQRLAFFAHSLWLLGLFIIVNSLNYQLWLEDASITQENALLELSQGGLLLIAASIHAGIALLSRTGIARDLRIGLALFSLLLLLREVDIDKLGTGSGWGLLELTLRALALLMLIAFVLHMMPKLKSTLAQTRQILRSPAIYLSLLACVFYLVGSAFDRELFDISKDLSLWFEETLELDACLLLLCAAFFTGFKQPSASSPLATRA